MDYKFKNITIDLEDDLVGVMVYFKETSKIKTYWFSLPDILDIDKLMKDTTKIINK
jgi:hypothetical protein